MAADLCSACSPASAAADELPGIGRHQLAGAACLACRAPVAALNSPHGVVCFDVVREIGRDPLLFVHDCDALELDQVGELPGSIDLSPSLPWPEERH